MFESTNLWLFIAATVSLNITPGPDLIYIASRSVQLGRRAGIISALGVGSGCVVHTMAAALGLSTILSYSSSAYEIVRYAGAAYLVYLGVKSIMTPKVALFFLSFLPQFVRPEGGSPVIQFLALGGIFIFSGTIVSLIAAFLAGSAGEWMNKNPVFWKVQKWFTGSVLIGLGVRLAIIDRR